MESSMESIAEIVKHITLSKSLTIASLFTSAVLLFGSKYFPGDIESVPIGWNWAVIAVFVFTASLTIFWLLNAVLKLFLSGLYKIKNILPTHISENEEELLRILAQCADQTLNLKELFDSNQERITKLQLLDLSKRLCKKGCIVESYLDENIVYLTEKGRHYALKLETKIHAKQKQK